MAKVIKRIGTLAQKFSIDLTVHSVRMTLSIPVKLNIIWKRKKRRVEARNKLLLPANSQRTEMEETLTMINTMYQKKSGEFLEKKAVLTFQAIVEGRGSKVVGTVTLNIAQFIPGGIRSQEFRVEKCPDKTAVIVLSLRAQAMGELVEADNMSEVSGGTGFTMGTEDVGGGLLSEQDLTGFDDEPHPNPTKTMIAGNIRPMVPRVPIPPSSKSERPGPIRPLHIIEESPTDRQKGEEMKTHIAQLEKEKTDIQREKEELMRHYSASVESGKREKEQLIEHIQELEEQMVSLSSRADSYEKAQKAALETCSVHSQALEKANFDLRRSERIAAELAEERNRLASDLAKARQQQSESEQEITRLKEAQQQTRSEITRSESVLSALRQQNESLKNSLEQMQKDLVLSKEALSARSTESDTAFVVFRQKTEAMVNDLKKQLREADTAREEALSRETETTLAVQTLKQEMAQVEAKSKRALAVRDKEITEIQADTNELIAALEDERDVWNNERQSITTAISDVKGRLEKMTRQYEEIVSEKETLQQSQTALERQMSKGKSDLSREESAKRVLEAKVESLEASVFEAKKTNAQLERQLKDLAAAKLKAEEQCFALKTQLNASSQESATDRSASVLQDQINSLERQLAEAVEMSQGQSEKLQERIEFLERHNEILEKQKRQLAEQLEGEVSKLRAENDILRSATNEKKTTGKSEKLISSVNEESLKQTVQMMKVELGEANNKVKRIEEEIRTAEKKYVDAKMGWASADLERETALQKLRESQEKLRQMSQEYTMIEVEFYKVNERLGQTLNMQNDLENENQQLRISLSSLSEPKGKKKR